MNEKVEYNQNGREDSRLSISACILFYQMLLNKNRIRKNGLAVKRMHELEKRYLDGERNFKREK